MFVSSQGRRIHAFVTILMCSDRCFCWFLVAILVPLRWAPTWRLDTFLRMENCTDLNLGEGLCVNLAPFISQILDFIYWTVLSFDAMIVKASNIGLIILF